MFIVSQKKNGIWIVWNLCINKLIWLYKCGVFCFVFVAGIGNVYEQSHCCWNNVVQNVLSQKGKKYFVKSITKHTVGNWYTVAWDRDQFQYIVLQNKCINEMSFSVVHSVLLVLFRMSGKKKDCWASWACILRTFIIYSVLSISTSQFRWSTNRRQTNTVQWMCILLLCMRQKLRIVWYRER